MFKDWWSHPLLQIPPTVWEEWQRIAESVWFLEASGWSPEAAQQNPFRTTWGEKVANKLTHMKKWSYIITRKTGQLDLLPVSLIKDHVLHTVHLQIHFCNDMHETTGGADDSEKRAAKIKVSTQWSASMEGIGFSASWHQGKTLTCQGFHEERQTGPPFWKTAETLTITPWLKVNRNMT